MAELDTVKTQVHSLEDCANPLDLAIVLDVSGSMDDDTCSTTGLSHGCSPWWESSTDVFYEDFSSYTTGDGDLEPTTLCGANSPWSCEEVDRVGTRNDSRSLSGGGNYAQTEGWSSGSDGRFNRYFDASPYDEIEVAFYQRTYNCSGDDRIRGRYAPGGPWLTFMDFACSDTWRQRVYSRDSQAAGTFGLQFGVYAMEDADYGLFDNVRVRGVMNGKGPSIPVYCSSYNSNCTCGVSGGSSTLGCSFAELAARYKAQPIWDTLNAADWFISDCHLGPDPGAPRCVDPTLDQIGLAYYSDDGTQNNFYPASGDSTTASELSSDYSAITNTLWTQFSAAGWTNIGDGIYRGSEILSTNQAEGHHGRTNAVHVMILLSDGIPNRPCNPATMNCNVDAANTWSLQHIDNAVDWAVQNGVIIFTISLGSRADQTLMTDIAEATGGTHQYAESTDELGGHLRSIVEQLRCTPPRPDTDGDGLLDEFEYADQCPYWDNPDSDNDGYSDGAEVFHGWDPCDPYDPQTPTATSTSTPTATSTSTPTATSTSTSTNTPTATSTSTNTPTATNTSTPTNTPTIWPVVYVPLTLKSY